MRAILIAAAAALFPVPAAAETVAGQAEVVDGDTLAIGDRRIRLFGIDAPELAQPCHRDGRPWSCGEAAREQLRQLVGSNAVECSGDEVDRHGRLVAVCRSAGFELNRTMVEYGWATAFRSYSDAYLPWEIRAKQARRGIWSSTFDPPQSYRIAQAPDPDPSRSTSPPRRAAAPRAFSGGCVIKGNRNRRGEWIYHLPGMPYYDRTRAEEMFCSEAAAQAAGYRRAIVR